MVLLAQNLQLDVKLDVIRITVLPRVSSVLPRLTSKTSSSAKDLGEAKVRKQAQQPLDSSTFRELGLPSILIYRSTQKLRSNEFLFGML